MTMYLSDSTTTDTENTVKKIIVPINLLGQDFSLQCLPHEEAELRNCAELLNNELRKIQQQSPQQPFGRMLLLAALNLALSLSKLQNQKNTQQTLETACIDRMLQKLNYALSQD